MPSKSANCRPKRQIADLVRFSGFSYVGIRRPVPGQPSKGFRRHHHSLHHTPHNDRRRRSVDLLLRLLLNRPLSYAAVKGHSITIVITLPSRSCRHCRLPLFLSHSASTDRRRMSYHPNSHHDDKRKGTSFAADYLRRPLTRR